MEFVDPQVDLDLLQDLQQLQELQDLPGSMGQISCPAGRTLSESGARQGLDVSVSLGRTEAETGALAWMQGTAGAESGDTAVSGSMAGTGSRVEFGRKAETVAAAAAAAVGWADFVPKVWAVLLLPAVLAEVWAAEAGQWVWLGGTESESAVGSWSEAWSYQCQGLSASDSSDTATPGPADREQIIILTFVWDKNILVCLPGDITRLYWLVPTLH